MFISRIFLICISISLISSCTQYSKMKLMTLEDDLQTNVRQFNKRFSGKMMNISVAYVSLEKRRDFLIDSNEIKEKVTFFNNSILDIQYFDGDQPVKKTTKGAKKEFNVAIVTMRYQISVLPSNQLKSIIIDQKWLLSEEQWQVEPDLSVFLK